MVHQPDPCPSRYRSLAYPVQHDQATFDPRLSNYSLLVATRAVSLQLRKGLRSATLSCYEHNRKLSNNVELITGKVHSLVHSSAMQGIASIRHRKSLRASRRLYFDTLNHYSAFSLVHFSSDSNSSLVFCLRRPIPMLEAIKAAASLCGPLARTDFARPSFSG